MKYLITGGCGFLGSNLAAAAIAGGHSVVVMDNLSRTGASDNLRWLSGQGLSAFVHADTRSKNDLDQATRQHRPDVVFHLAGQVAMTTSIADPRKDFETNVLGGHNLLESVRTHAPEAVVIYSSTNKVYGDLEHLQYRDTGLRYEAVGFENGFDEAIGLDFRSPYGCSKGAVDQYMLDYSRVFGLKTVVFRHSSIFGARQFSTYDQGWVGWFVKQALDLKRGKIRGPVEISGDGKQVRDVLFSTDLIRCYALAIQSIDRARGQAFNIGGGMANSFSLLELFGFLSDELSVEIPSRSLPWRSSDQKVFVADTGKASRLLGWSPMVDKKSGIRAMIDWVGGSS